MAGCGGGGDDSSTNTSTESKTESSTDSDTGGGDDSPDGGDDNTDSGDDIPDDGDDSPDGGDDGTSEHVLDGLYLNDTDLAILLIDSDLPTQSVLFGDYSGSNSALINDSHAISGNTMTTTGAAMSSSGTYSYDASLETTIDATIEGATITSTINGTNFVYSFNRTQDSAPLGDIIGDHVNGDENSGSLWTIYDDSRFIIVGICTVTGTLERVKHYYIADNVETTNCASDPLNATDYKARIVTVEQFGFKYLLAVFMNDSAVILESTPLQPQ